MKQRIKLLIEGVISQDCFGDESLSLKENDWCIIKTSRCQDIGRVTGISPLGDDEDTAEMPEAIRKATLVDQGKANENSFRNKSLQRKAQAIIEKHDLPMNLVATHLSFDRSFVIFMFLAPGRVDFRDLLKDLNKEMNLRVELRQIGPRDQAGMIGGIGACGRELCCSSFLKNFVSINVKMAKTQGLSLNPSNIIGACGRLKCCLDYEYEGYKILLEKMPRIGSRCQCDDCDGVVIDRDILSQKVTVELSDDRIIEVPVEKIKMTSG